MNRNEFHGVQQAFHSNFIVLMFWAGYNIPVCETGKSEDCLLVQKGYERCIIRKDETVFCEIIDRKIYLNLVLDEVTDYYERIENLETNLDGGIKYAYENDGRPCRGKHEYENIEYAVPCL